MAPLVRLAAAALLLIAVMGCDDCDQCPAPRRPERQVEIPVVNLTRALRVQNYKGGSCVHASTGADFNWLNQFDLQRKWNAKYSGGESYNGLVEKLRANNIPFYATANGDVAVLDRCTRERRGATIFYYPNHSITFCGFDGDSAYVLDNNRIDAFIQIPKATFVRNWKSYGGVAVVPTLGAPRPPMPWVAASL